MAENKKIDKFIKNVMRELSDVNRSIRSREESTKLAVQLLGAVGTVMMGPYCVKREPTRQEFEALLIKMSTSAFNAILDEMKKHDSSNWN
jgi:hypothetical protein